MRPWVTIVIALVVGVVLGTVLARTDVAEAGDLLAEPRVWLIGAAVLAALASGPLVGALTGLAAMLGVLGTLEVLPWNVGDIGSPELRAALKDLVDDTRWLDVPLLAGAAAAGAAVGTIRWALRVGRRLLLVVIAVVALVAIVGGVPELADTPFSDGPEITVIR